MPFGKSKGYCNQGTELMKTHALLAEVKLRVEALEKAITDHRWNHKGDPSENDLALWGHISVNP